MNTITVKAVTEEGATVEASVSVNNVPYIPQYVGSILRDGGQGDLYVADRARGIIYRLDPTNGDMTLITGPGIGSGPPIGVAVDMVISGDELLLADLSVGGGLTAVSLDDGSRRVVSGETTGAGPSWGTPRALVPDQANPGRAYVLDHDGDVFVVNTENGDRSLLSSFDPDQNEATDDAVGSGPAIGNPLDIVHDGARGRLLVSGFSLDKVFAVDTTTGDRTIFTELPEPSLLALDSSANRVLVSTTPSIPAVYGIDLDNGESQLLMDKSKGEGPEITYLNGMTAPDDNGQVFLAAGLPRRVIVMNTASGDRSYLPSITIGSGENLVNASGLAFDAVNARLLVGDVGVDPATVLALNLADGTRDLVSGMARGTGESLPYIGSVKLSADGSALWLGAGATGLMTVDVASGDRRMVSGGGVGSGPDLDMNGFTLQEARSRALVVDRYARTLFGVNLADG